MYKSKLSKVIVSLLRRIAGVTRSGAKRLMRAMLQALMAMGRRARLPVAGFVLPTVTMVLLVVILLTVAIVFRSFDRANIARNVRVNQQVLAAATPALDRAKAKIQFMLYEDPQRPTSTPSDREMYRMMATYPPNPSATDPDLYTFGEEERLKVNLRGATLADPKVTETGFNLETSKSINTAWRYPVDTNNDGKFDTFTLYGILFRSPERNNTLGDPNLGEFKTARGQLDARTPPMSGKALNPNCVQGGGTVASLVGDSGWYKIDGKLKKSFFVYTVNVPIKQEDIANVSNPSKYLPFTGTPSISALEYQQDQSRVPLANNAVVYEDDLDISPGLALNLNGRIFTNSNFLVTSLGTANDVKLYQVSSEDSCFYEQENSKIVVAGNVVNGWSGDNKKRNAVQVHLFKKLGSVGGRSGTMVTAAKTIQNPSPAAESTSQESLKVLYNNEEYADRLSLLVATQMGPPIPPNNVPEQDFLNSDPFLVQRRPKATQTREQALREYFKQMLRKVPFAEVGPPGVGATQLKASDTYGPTPPKTSPLEGTQDTLRPLDTIKWSIPDAATTGIALTPGQLKETPKIEGSTLETEQELGDRVDVGNNLPAQRWENGKFTSGTYAPTGRKPKVTKLADVGATDRGGFWEGAAAETPKNPLDGIGGLRVITSAGVYERINSFLPPPTWIKPSDGTLLGNGAADTYDDPTTLATEKYPVVWPDTMPMSPLGVGSLVYDNAVGLPYVNTNWKTLSATPPALGTFIPPGGLTPTGLTAGVATIIEPTPIKYAKGDLRMRATAVYHYVKGGYDPTVKPLDFSKIEPFACVSSYYDPSTASTAKNLSTLPDVSGQNLTLNPPELGTPGDQVGSNNGIVYGKPADRRQAVAVLGADGLLSTTPNDLGTQANYVFPDGRFANEPLRKALLKVPGERKLAERAAIDSTMCALKILAAPTTDFSTDIPNGAIQEVAFLNAREIKAIDRDDWTTPFVNEAFTLSSPFAPPAPVKLTAELTGNYNQPLEEREPLEIRATKIDLNLLRGKSVGGEPLLPYSGIIYASRDDALPDRSFRIAAASILGGIDEDRSATVSSTDSLIDPTRKPNGILLVNGKELARVPPLPPTVANVVREKGLTLASNLPVYIKGDFNVHTQEEFGVPKVPPVAFDWSKFYDRTAADLNKNFACRPNDPRLSGCTTGDAWRPANVLADSVTLFSDNYRFGFRNEGDFDLRNNAGAAAVLLRKQQGFYNNNFVTNGLTSGAFSATGGTLVRTGGTTVTDIDYANANAPRSSYFNNFVTPVQRRGKFPEYVMEVCTKLPVSACTDADWFVDPLASPQLTTATAGAAYLPPTDLTSKFKAGSTVDPPVPALQRFPRRVAFSRVTFPQLETPPAPQPLGITNRTTVIPGTGTAQDNSLWFATTATSGINTVTYGSEQFPYVFNQARVDGSGVVLPLLAAASSPPWLNGLPPSPNNGSQPLLMPVLQIQTMIAGSQANSSTLPSGTPLVAGTGWMPQAPATGATFNLIMGANDTPSRTMSLSVGDFNGGLQNLPRFLENWRPGGTFANTNIQGAFIQFDRSKYSTAPYTPILDPDSPQQQGDQPSILRSLFDKPPALAPSFAQATPASYAGGALEPSYRTANGAVKNNTAGRVPFFFPPGRNWGFDVGLLSQPPDLFTQKFTTPPSRPSPDEYFREVPRNDEWVKALMCSQLAGGTNANATSSRPPGTFQTGGCPT